MKLKELRLERCVEQKEITKVLQQVEPRIRNEDVSRYETGVCLPTPPQLQKICQLLGADPDEIYTPDEMDLAGCYKIGHSGPPKQANDKTHYKLTANVPQSIASGLKTKTAACGYGSITGWIEAKLKELDQEYKSRPDVGAPEAAKKNSQPKNTTKEANLQ